MEFSKVIQGIKPSATLSITSKAKQLLSGGEDVVILAAGEPDFDTPDNIKDAAIMAIKRGDTKYTPASGTAGLKEAVCRKLLKENGLSYDKRQIIVSGGAKHSIYNVLQVLCNPGDEVIVLSPYWLSYPEMVKLAGAVPKVVSTDPGKGFKPDIDDIKKSITGKTKAIIINSPSNPAGVVYSIEELGQIAQLCLDSGIRIISDEIYEKIVFGGDRHNSIASISEEVKDITVLINGVSKSFSMTGWRIGYAAMDSETASLVSTLQSQSTSNPCSISQAAAECALVSDMEEEIRGFKDLFLKRRDLLMELLSKEDKLTPFKPSGAFYLFCGIEKTGLDSMTFSERLLEEKKVAVIPGGPFGEDSFIRISFAADEKKITEGVGRLIDWVNGK